MASADITSIYRLFLRATSASVLHHPAASKSLRRLWRPVFNEAIINTRKLHDTRLAQEHEKLRGWLCTWERRVDSTLSFLSNAAQYRGLPHDITRNIALLASNHIDVHHDLHAPRTTWNPSLKPTDAAYEVPQPGSKRYARFMEQRERRAVSGVAMNVFSEVVSMAEGQRSLTLGRVVPR